MVGNDIIDISETRHSTHWERPGFIQKLFTPKEQEYIYASVDPFIRVWHLWSMKESAYKVFIQTGAERFFNPSKIECHVDSLQSGRVRIADTSIKTSTLINGKYIFSTAKIDHSDIETRIFKLTDNDRKNQSKFMHQHVLIYFAKKNALDQSQLFLKKTKTGIPIIQYRNKPLKTAFSITHHGNYGAYSILKR
ncbi:MAG: phosphopantetheinyl transferase (holo-ACP synthase) [Salibacteraceae bacterium]|jgi:phosphopantetheinyl transferase (holo-ACP synthase)